MKHLRSKLTYANVISTLCLFLVLGGGAAFAATQLPKNSVGPKQLKANSVTAAKIKNGAVTGAKLNLAALGTVPSATRADSASHADSATRADFATRAAGATTADSATIATSAANAGALGGVAASGYQGRIMWARVNNGGEIVAQSGGITLQSHSGNGLFVLRFPQPVAGKGILGTVLWTGPTGGKSVVVKATPCGSGGADCSGLGSNTTSDLFAEITEGSSAIDANFYVAVLP
jgi:hypothetical protein